MYSSDQLGSFVTKVQSASNSVQDACGDERIIRAGPASNARDQGDEADY